MMRLITICKTMLAALLLSFTISLGMAQPALAQKQSVCEGATFAGSGCGGGDAQISGLVQTVINIISLIAGIAAVIIIIISGLRLIVSAGDADGLKNARNGIIYAIVGLVIIAFAQIIVRFVLGRINT